MFFTGMVLLLGSLWACLLPQPIDAAWLAYLPIILLWAVFAPVRPRLGLFFVASMLWSSFFVQQQLSHRLTSEMNNKRLVITGEVISIPQNTKYSTRFALKVIQSSTKLRKIRVNWSDAPSTLKAGQIWKLKLQLRQPHGLQNPGGFDYERWLFVQGFDATAKVLSSPDNRYLGMADFSLSAVRESILDTLNRYCEQCQHSGLIKALSIGYRGDINVQVRQLLQDTATAHLLAISGLHVGIVAGSVYWLAHGLWWLFPSTRINQRQFAISCAWLAGLSYSLLAGFELPAQRAMLMLSVVWMAWIFRAPLNLLHSISLALLAVIVVHPLSVLSESFWLTFSALFIIAFGGFLHQNRTSSGAQLWHVQLLFSVLVIPISAFIFARIHVGSLIANMIAVPVVSLVIVPFNFLLLALNLVGLPETWISILYALLDQALVILLLALQGLLDIGLTPLAVSGMNAWQIILLLVLLLIILLPSGLYPMRYGLLLPVLWIFFVPVTRVSHGQFLMTVLDVGMGTALTVQTKNHTLVYDFGPGYRDGYSMGRWVVKPYLLHQGRYPPDRMIISHADNDHAGGYLALQPELQRQQLLTGTRQELQAKIFGLTGLQDCSAAQSWHWDGVYFELLSTRFVPGLSENNRSCVLKVHAGSESVLIAGDIERFQEFALIRKYSGYLQSDILIAPHHGSMTSSSQPFIDKVDPKKVIFTAGYLNRWGFPRRTVLQRYQKIGAEVLRTDRTGAIQIDCKPAHCQLLEYRRRLPRLWY